MAHLKQEWGWDFGSIDMIIGTLLWLYTILQYFSNSVVSATSNTVAVVNKTGQNEADGIMMCFNAALQ